MQCYSLSIPCVDIESNNVLQPNLSALVNSLLPRL